MILRIFGLGFFENNKIEFLGVKTQKFLRRNEIFRPIKVKIELVIF